MVEDSKAGKKKGSGGSGAGKSLDRKESKAVVDPTVVTEQPGEGKMWHTVANESGRRFCLTLHPGKPEPLPPGKAFSVLLCPADVPGSDSVRVRLLLLPVKLPPTLPLRRSAVQPSEGIHLLEGQMEAGQAVMENFVFGVPEDAPLMGSPTQQGCLVATSFGAQHGYLNVTLPLKVNPPRKADTSSAASAAAKGGKPVPSRHPSVVSKTAASSPPTSARSGMK